MHKRKINGYITSRPKSGRRGCRNQTVVFVKYPDMSRNTYSNEDRMKSASSSIAQATIEATVAPVERPQPTLRYAEPERLSKRASLAVILGLSALAWAGVAILVSYLVG